MSEVFPEENQAREKAEARQELERSQLLEDFKRTFSTASGHRVFWHILIRCHFISSVWAGNSSIHRLAAERDVGLHFVDVLGEADPELLADILTMGLQEEARERRKDYERDL